METPTRIIQNPVLPGFHPDPSILRVGDTYIVANSTFEWFPGIRLHTSTDLVHWNLFGHVLTDPAHLSLPGIPDSGGVWAPSLSYFDERFWLVYAVVRSRSGPAKDMAVFLTTATDPRGPWSEPVYLDSRGFDPSLFHDADGTTYLVNMRWDHRSSRPNFAGIHLQELDLTTRRLVGTPRQIVEPDGLLEGPNLYRFGGRYHLLLAEGGTGWNHGIRAARADDLDGPWSFDPRPLLTTRDLPPKGSALHKAGHGELVETPDGELYLVHLVSRPVDTANGPMSILGRETCLQRVVWNDQGWLRLAQGGHHPDVQVPAPSAQDPAPADVAEEPAALSWVSLRRPIDDGWVDTTTRPGWTMLRGQESLHSLFEQALLGSRVTATAFRAQAQVELDAHDWCQRAGLVAYYDTVSHAFLYRSVDDAGRPCLGLEVCDAHTQRDDIVDLDIGGWPEVHLRVDLDGPQLTFLASPDGSTWLPVGEPHDAGTLSDDHAGLLRFTGSFVGLCSQDLAEHGSWAAFGRILIGPPEAGRDTVRVSVDPGGSADASGTVNAVGKDSRS